MLCLSASFDTCVYFSVSQLSLLSVFSLLSLVISSRAVMSLTLFLPFLTLKGQYHLLDLDLLTAVLFIHTEEVELLY